MLYRQFFCIKNFMPTWSSLQNQHWGQDFFMSTLAIVVQSVMSDSATPWTAAHQASVSFTISQSLLKLMSSESVMSSPVIFSSATLFSFCPQSFPASRSFPVNRLFASDGQILGTSALASILPMNIQGWFPLGLTDLISLLSKGLSRIVSSTTVLKH